MTDRSSASRSSSRTTSTPPAWPRRPVPGRSPAARRTTRSSSSSSRPPVPWSSARPTCPSGRTSGPDRRRAAGAGSAARRTWPTSSIAIPAARAPAPASSRPLTSQLPPSAPRPMARSSAPRARTRTSASSRRSGSWSRAGVVPIAADQDTAGPMARNVTDAAVLLGAMTGVDSDDPATAEQAGNAFTDYTQFLDADALDGARIGVWREGSFEAEASGRRGRRPRSWTTRSRRSKPRARRSSTRPTSRSADWATPSSRRCCASSRPTSPRTWRPTPRARTRLPAKTLQDLIDFNNDHPELESGAPESELELAGLRPRPGDRRPRRRHARDSARVATPGAQAAIDDTHGRATTSTRSSPRPTVRRGSPTRSTVTSVATSRRSSVRRVRPRSPATRT